MERPQGQAAAMRFDVAPGGGAGGGFAVPPQGHGLGQVGELAGVGDLGDVGDGGGGPAVALVVLDGQAELLGAGS